MAEIREALDRLGGLPPDTSRAALLSRALHALQAPERSLPRLPEAVIQAVKVVESPRCDVLDLADTLNAEPSIAARVAAIANSAFFAGPEPVYTARDAVVRMGIRETRNIVMGVALRDLLLEGPGYAIQRRQLWQRSLATAACAQGIMCEISFDDGSGFMAGLAHDLGRATIFTWASELEGGPATLDAITPVAQALHMPLAALILRQWRLGNDLVLAVRDYHRVMESRSAMAVALEAAERMARHLIDGEAAITAASDPALCGLLGELGIDANRLVILMSDSSSRLDELMKVL